MTGSEFATVISLAFDYLISLLWECKLQERQDLCPLCSLTYLKDLEKHLALKKDLLTEWMHVTMYSRDLSGVQWLRIHLVMQGPWVQSHVVELRSHMLQGN